MIPTPFRTSFPRRQRGAALVIGLLLLAVITLLAISGMNSASLELSMAANAQNRQRAFQASESGIEQLFQDATLNPNVTVPQTTNDVELDGGKLIYNASVKVDLGGKAQPAIWGNSWDAFSTYHFQISSVGKTKSGGAETVHRQGVATIAPLDPGVTGPDPFF